MALALDSWVLIGSLQIKVESQKWKADSVLVYYPALLKPMLIKNPKKQSYVNWMKLLNMFTDIKISNLFQIRKRTMSFLGISERLYLMKFWSSY